MSSLKLAYTLAEILAYAQGRWDYRKSLIIAAREYGYRWRDLFVLVVQDSAKAK